MALRDLDYQGRVLARLNDYLTELSGQKLKADKIIAAQLAEFLQRRLVEIVLVAHGLLRSGNAACIPNKQTSSANAPAPENFRTSARSSSSKFANGREIRSCAAASKRAGP